MRALKSVRAWIAQAERGELKATLGATKLTADQQRIRELERELVIAKMERDIFKKAAMTFAKLSVKVIACFIPQPDSSR